MALSERVPTLYALDLIFDAIDAAISEDVFEGRPIRLQKTFSGIEDLEDIQSEFFVVIRPDSVESEVNTSEFDEYMVTIVVEVLTACGSVESMPDQKYRSTLQISQTITDQIRKRVRKHFVRSDSALIEDEMLDELRLIGVAFTHTLKVLQPIPA